MDSLDDEMDPLEAELLKLGFTGVNPEWFADQHTVTAEDFRESVRWEAIQNPNRSHGQSGRRTSTEGAGGILFLRDPTERDRR